MYAESCQPINPGSDQIKIFADQFETLPKLNQFKSTWDNVPKANGEYLDIKADVRTGTRI